MLGYIIGMETALGSYVAGKSVARYLHRYVNPTLAAEADAAKKKSKQGVPMNTELPDFERRFLPDLDMGHDCGMVLFYPAHQIDSLSRWRSSTETARRVGHPLLELLTDIETALLARHQPFLHPEADSVARAQGWDVTALQQWVDARAGDLSYLPSLSSESACASDWSPHVSWWFTLPVAAALVAAVYVVLLMGLCLLNTRDAPTITYRTMVYVMMFAPSGAILRWRLSGLNGTWPLRGWEWLPVGTLVANVFGSMVSAAAVAGEVYFDDLYNSEVFWTVGTIRAVKVGFAGCLTTVSTFAVEVSGFMHGSGKDSGHGYPYILTTLGLSCSLASCVYGLIVVFAPRVVE
jgi:fluoride ion exporter CrcB/FEX